MYVRYVVGVVLCLSYSPMMAKKSMHQGDIEQAEAETTN